MFCLTSSVRDAWNITSKPNKGDIWKFYTRMAWPSWMNGTIRQTLKALISYEWINSMRSSTSIWNLVHSVDNGNICGDVSLVLRYAPIGCHYHAEPINLQFLILFPSTTYLVARAAMAKKGTNPPLPSCLSRQVLPYLFPSPLTERHYPSNPQLLSQRNNNRSTCSVC